MSQKSTPSVMQKSELDSERFGLNIVRAKLKEASPKALAAELLASDYDVAIIRLPAGVSSRIFGMKNWALPVIHADTLVYYMCDLTRHSPAPLRNGDLDFALATHSDMPELESLILLTFQEYKSHYHANPLFEPEKILEGYQDWAKQHLSREGCMLWVARRDNYIAAFAACQRVDQDTFEGVLYGVHPKMAGSGLYGDLIRHTQEVAKSEGSRVMIVSTQVNNFAVQKVWSREGFHIFEAWDTFHINAVRKTGESIYTGEICFSEQRIRDFAAVTGDDNPLHLDLHAARAKGLPGPIAHGVMTLGEISRVLGTQSPGAGTVIVHLDSVYLEPIVAGRTYRIEMLAPEGLPPNSTFEVVSSVYDADDKLCVVVRSDVLKR